MLGPDHLDPGIAVDGDRSVSSARWDHGLSDCNTPVRPRVTQWPGRRRLLHIRIERGDSG